MAVVEMRKISVIGLNTSRSPFFQELMRLGVVEINSKEGLINDEEWVPDIFRTSNSADVSRQEAAISRVKTALEAIGKYDHTKKPLLYSRKEIDQDEFTQYIDTVKMNVAKSADKAVAADKAMADAKTEINRIQTIIAGLTPWASLDIPLETTETQSACIVLGTVNGKTDFSALQAAVREKAPSAVVLEINADKQQKYLLFISLKTEKESVFEVLRQFAFSPVSLSGGKGTPSEQIKQYEKDIEKWKATIAEQEEILASLVPIKKDMEYFYDNLVLQRDRAKIVGDMLSTETVFYFDGWFPKRSQEKVENLLQKYEFYYKISEPQPDEEVPVLLQNNPVVSAFEGVTGMYSLPSRHDIDPTAVLAPFYFLFFGLMLSDAAYGIILSVGCAILLKKFKPEGNMRRMLKMFFYCGISTFMWGALFGGWFGDFFTVAARVMFGIDNFVIAPIWFNPLEEPMKLLIFSLILGGIHLFVGMGVQAYILIRDGHPLDALFDIGLWYLLLIGLVLLGVGGMLAPALSTVGKYMALVGVVGILVTGGRKKKGFGKITGGLGSLYGITNYLSDVLSYSRLLALGLATGVVAQVINTLGSLAGGGIIGSIVLIVVFLAGTIFNIAINALGAFVHSCRLQYVEFFGKFYEGGGREFRPFERKTKYVKFIEEDVKDGR